MFFELAVAVVAVVDVVCCEAGPSPVKEMNSGQQRSTVYIKNKKVRRKTYISCKSTAHIIKSVLIDNSGTRG
jgi:hypothetical protein